VCEKCRTRAALNFHAWPVRGQGLEPKIERGAVRGNGSFLYDSARIASTAPARCSCEGTSSPGLALGKGRNEPAAICRDDPGGGLALRAPRTNEREAPP